MKICFVGFEIVPRRNGIFLGGWANNAMQLAKGLVKRGHEVLVLTSDINHAYREPFFMDSVEMHPLSIGGKYGSARSGAEFILKAIPAIAKEHQRRKFDVLHLHSAYPPFGLISLLSRALVRMPKVFTLYSPIQPKPLRDRKGIYPSLSSPFLSRPLLSGVKLIAISQNVKRSLIKTGFKEADITFLPPVIDTTQFNPKINRYRKREELKVAKETPLVLYCGNWAGWKGIDVLLEGMVHVLKDSPEVKLVTAWGEAYHWYDERKAAIRQKIQDLHLGKNIIELGIIKDIENLMASCNVFMAPFLNTDGVADYPVSILEAMACGTPVVATKVGGIPEIINHEQNGLLVMPGNPDELAKAISYIFENRDKAQQMGKEGARFVQQNFSPDIIIEKLEKLYAELL